MDTRRIRKLIELVQETGINELEVTSGDETVRIRCQSPSIAAPAVAATPRETITQQPALASAQATPAPQAEPTPKHSPPPSGHYVKSPMVGTVYLSSNPGNPPFVAIGNHVNKGDTLCLIEAMKMFNKIEADQSGVVSQRLVDNEQPVEFDQALFIIDPDE